MKLADFRTQCLRRNTKFRINPTISVMTRAIFEHVQGGIKKNAQHESCRVMFHIQLLFWTISIFSGEIWRNRGLKMGIEC